MKTSVLENEGSKRWEGCFLTPLMHRKRETAHPFPTKTKAFIKLSPDTPMPFLSFRCSEPPPVSACSCRTHLPRTRPEVTTEDQNLTMSILITHWIQPFWDVIKLLHKSSKFCFLLFTCCAQYSKQWTPLELGIKCTYNLFYSSNM